MTPCRLIIIVCAGLLITIVVSLIASRAFRREILGSESNAATIFNFITVRGAAVIVLCGLLLATMLMALPCEGDSCGAGSCIRTDGSCGKVFLKVGSANLHLDQHANEKTSVAVGEGDPVYSREIKNGDRMGYAVWMCEANAD